jgi:hypothetical protein
MSTPEDIPAFPYSVEIKGPQDDPFNESDPVPAGISRTYAFAGMSLRDYFAAKAMAAAIAHYGIYDESLSLALTTPATDSGYCADTLSEIAYVYADSMLAERSKA